MESYARSPELIPKLLESARKNPQNLNGIYNTLVLLSHLNYSMLPSAHFSEIRAFAESVRSRGSKISERVDVLLQRLPK